VENYPNRVLKWSDEFNTNGGFNTTNWNALIGNGVNGWGNGELEYYTTSNAATSSGSLIITAKKEAVGSFQYTSSRLVSKLKFKYGIFEARLKIPKGAGTWSGFWLLGENSSLAWPTVGKTFFCNKKHFISMVFI
jgi:beta-glucanase (GH16 family)